MCSKALDSAKPNAVIGFSLLQSPPGLVLLLSSGQVVSLNIITNSSFLRVNRQIDDDKSKDNAESSISSKVFAGSFVESVREILASGAAQPILKSNTGEDLLELNGISLTFACSLFNLFQLFFPVSRQRCISKRIHRTDFECIPTASWPIHFKSR